MSTLEWFLTGLIVLAYIVYDQIKDSRKRVAARTQEVPKRKPKKPKKRRKAAKKSTPEPAPEPSHKQDLLSALKSLGFGKSDSQFHAQKAMDHTPDASLEDLVRLALASSQNRLE